MHSHYVFVRWIGAPCQYAWQWCWWNTKPSGKILLRQFGIIHNRSYAFNHCFVHIYNVFNRYMERGPGLSASMFLTLAAQLTISVSEKLNNIAPHFLCVARHTSEQGLKARWRRRHKHNDLTSLLVVQNSYLTNRHPSSSLEARNGLSNMVCRSVGITLASTNSFTKIKNKGQLSNRSGAQSSIYII